MISFFRKGRIYGIPTDQIEELHPDLSPMEVLDAYDAADPAFSTNEAQDWTFFGNVEEDDIVGVDMEEDQVVTVSHWLEVLLAESDDPYTKAHIVGELRELRA